MVANETTLEAIYGGPCVIKFTESGYDVITDTRKVKVGYLHITEESSVEITEECRNQIIQYMFNHPDTMPGIGKTTMEQYFAGLTKADVESIGNNGKKAFYN